MAVLNSAGQKSVINTTLERIELKKNPNIAELALFTAEYLKEEIFPKIHSSIHKSPDAVAVKFIFENDKKIRKAVLSRESIDPETPNNEITNGMYDTELARQELEKLYSLEPENMDIIIDLAYQEIERENQEINLLKTGRAIKLKESRKSLEEMTDLVRTTLVFDQNCSEIELFGVLESIFEVMQQNPLVFNNHKCQWYTIVKEIDPRYRTTGYSDLSIVFFADLPLADNTSSKTVSFELQINTRSFLEAKKLETPIYDSKKIQTDNLNTILKQIANDLGLIHQPIKVTDLDELLDFLNNYRKEEFDGAEFKNKDYGRYILSSLIRHSAQLRRQDKHQKKQELIVLTEIITKPEKHTQIYTPLAKIFQNFALLHNQSKCLYANLSGLINSKYEAEVLKDKIVKLPNVEKMISRESMDSKIQFKRLNSTKRQLHPEIAA